MIKLNAEEALTGCLPTKNVHQRRIPVQILIYKKVLDRNVLRKPRVVGGVKGHNMNGISFPGSSPPCRRGASYLYEKLETS
jgi:hypothetical protein